MHIQDIRTKVITRQYDGSARNTRHNWSSKKYLLVSVDASNGMSGLGEVYCDGHGSPKVAELLIREELRPLLLGQDPRRIAQLRHALLERMVLSGRPQGFGPVMAGVDIALWDLLGRFCRLPVSILLGGANNRVRAYGSGGMYGPRITPDSLADEMAAAVRRGLSGIKIKGGGASLDEDIARAKAVRAAIGPDAMLMVDAMFLPDVPAAIRYARALAPLDLHFLEAPTTHADIPGWIQIARAGCIPLAGPEVEPSPDRMRDFLTSGAVHFLQFDVVLAGGLTVGRDMAALARAWHRPVTLHCAASAVGLAATAHLAASVTNCDSVEYHLMHQGLHERLWDNGWSLTDGHITVPDAPGLGLGFDLDDLADDAEGDAA